MWLLATIYCTYCRRTKTSWFGNKWPLNEYVRLPPNSMFIFEICLWSRDGLSSMLDKDLWSIPKLVMERFPCDPNIVFCRLWIVSAIFLFLYHYSRLKCRYFLGRRDGVGRGDLLQTGLKTANFCCTILKSQSWRALTLFIYPRPWLY